MSISQRLLILTALGISLITQAASLYLPDNSLPIWPHHAPGETTSSPGELQPYRPEEIPPVVRVQQITQPRLQVFLPKSSTTKTAILILPGGGYGKVVTNKEGSEAARWLNKLGIAAFVLSYRTTTPEEPRAWFRPLQDSHRAMRFIRSKADEWQINEDSVGLLGFSAGGQVAAIHLADTYPTSYDTLDGVDAKDHYPNFSLLIYPWNLLDKKTERLLPEIKLTKNLPPSFLVHTDDDPSSSLGTVAIYTALKKMRVPAELHIYQTGGHGYGMRSIPGSNIGSWPARAGDWLVARGFGRRSF